MFGLLNTVYATTPGCEAFNLSGCKEIKATIVAAVSTVNGLAFFLAALLLAVGGVLYITASGDKEKSGRAKTLLTQVLIGLAIILCINVILQIIVSILPNQVITIPSGPSAQT